MNNTVRSNLTIVTAPAAEPVSTSDFKDHARISTSADDTLIATYIKAARRAAEHFTGRAFINQTWKLTLDEFPSEDGQVIYLPRSPIVSITTFTYNDTNGDSQSLTSSDYRLDVTSEPGRIVPTYATSWPDTRGQIGDIAITYLAGYGAASTNMPEDLIHAVKLIAAHFYENRESTSEVSMSEIPMGARMLMMPYWIGDLA